MSKPESDGGKEKQGTIVKIEPVLIWMTPETKIINYPSTTICVDSKTVLIGLFIIRMSTGQSI